MHNPHTLILPDNIKPVSYQLELEPNLDKFTFAGKETVHIEVSVPTTDVTLNCIEIDIQSVKLTLSTSKIITPVNTMYDTSQETVTLKFDYMIPSGPAKLDFEYTGVLNDQLRGFYRSRYTDTENQERYIATTQFEATDARRAFPCWDEPSLKATFDVALVVPTNLVALSNMPIVSKTETRPGTSIVQFAKTPMMSTYLLAFVVGDLAAIERRATNGTLIRVWTTAGKQEQGRFALETSSNLLAYFNEYFGIPFPLPKLDHIAIPDFAAGAMENWGAITYRETALLVDPAHSSSHTRQWVAQVIAHEMAHMWFGDLVTMSWWNDLWLNESFATWMGDKAVDHLFPEWDMWTQFLTTESNRALSLDGLRNSHPIEQEVTNPAEIGQLFDAISYSKGASIIRMLEQFLNPQTFRQGLHQYLIQHEYGNAQTRDLWNALSTASGQPVSAIMDSWVNQMGYPLLNISVNHQDNQSEITCSQSRFVYENILGQHNPDKTWWHIPITARSASDAQPISTLMESSQTNLSVVPASYGSRGEWIKINPMQTGFYRVKYPTEELDKLTTPIQSLVLPAADRLGIQNDAYALARAGHIHVTQFFQVAQSYINETDASVCADLAANLDSVDTLLWNESYYPLFQSFARNIFQPIARRIGWDAQPGEGHLHSLLRNTALTQLGSYEDRDALMEAKDRFSMYLDDPSNVHPDIRQVVFSLTAIQSNQDTYQIMWELQRLTTLQEEKNRLLKALSDFQRPDLLEETLQRSLSEDVRVQDTISVVTSVASNRLGLDLAWQFLMSNWTEFNRRYAHGGFGLMRLVSLTSGFTTPEKRDEVESFFQKNPAPAAERSILQSLERIDLNIAWLKHNHVKLSDWFDKMKTTDHLED